MPKAKVAITIEAELLEELDALIDGKRFSNRSQAIEAAVSDKIQRLRRTRLARESAKLNVAEEIQLSEEGLTADVSEWPEY